jgi:uncharacterized membrane protein
VELVVGTVVLRPYVFLFVVAFVVAGLRDIGWRRTAAFGVVVWPLAWLAEFSSTRTGIPFGLYQYTGVTRMAELYIADVPFMDSLSFTFLAYAAFCLARVALAHRMPSRTTLAVASGTLMMLLDVVIDPLAVRGDRWFLGNIFFYPSGGLYFGVPLSNFIGWLVVGAAGIALYLAVVGAPQGREPAPGVALYYAVIAFNLAMTGWIGEWRLFGVGFALHGAVALSLRCLSMNIAESVGFGRQGVQGA